MSDEIINQLASNTFTGNVNDLVITSSECGHIEVVKLLLKDSRVDPGAGNNYAIILASEYGHVEVVKLLLKDSRVGPTAAGNYAIRLASENGHVEVVKILLADSRVDPSADNNYAIRSASEYGHIEVVKILLESLKHRFSVVNYIEILIEAPKKTRKEILPEIKELLISHIMKYQWIMNNLLIQHLTIDLLSQINHFIAAN